MKTAPADLDSHAATHAAAGRVHEPEILPRGHEQYLPQHSRKPQGKPALTLGNIVHFVVGVVFLWPLLVFVGIVSSIGHLVTFIRSTCEAVLSTGFWFGLLVKERCVGLVCHKDDTKMLQLKGGRRAFWHEASRDWSNAGKALVGIGRRFSGAFGLGGLFAAFEQRIARATANWQRYVVATAPVGATPGDFPENYVIVDQLPPGGSSARLFVVRKRDDKGGIDESGPLFVLKYFDLLQGGNLESVVRESQAAELAKKLGLIIESNLGTRAFWYVMPYYQGQTLTRATLDGVKEARKQGARAVFDQQKLSLGWLHQVLQIIAQYHEAGVFHKDIKPDNLIVNGERIYLVDIGLMTPLASMHQLTTHGTEYFRDPEMVKLALEGREVRQVNASKFDIYSIGAVLYFAIEGEFPTSGPLSRFSPDVPLAVQWVANRAMAGMNQRYETARQMLTDVDYLCWAAAQGMLEQVKPADLPSFRGMPVPQHLMPPAQTGGYGATRHFSQGGYGAWYMAPAFRPQLRNRGWRWAAIAGGVLAGTVCLGGAGAATAVIITNANAQRGNQAALKQQSLASHLDGKHPELAPLYDQIERVLRERGVSREENKRTNIESRANLVPSLVAQTQKRAAMDVRRLKGVNISMGKPVPLPPPGVIFLAADPDSADAELAAGIEREFNIEAARTFKGEVTILSAAEREDLSRLVGGISDLQAMHREMAARFAMQGKAPPLVVLVAIERGAVNEAHLRTITPGYEWRDVIPFNNG
ncbi:MAG: hypothetical protein IT462_06135 [Planctomycetes bacterium]|nr:hypothetical protein [Planctomycetota bacterium]